MSKQQGIEELTDFLLTAPPAHWAAAASQFKPEYLAEAISELDARIQHSLRLRGYLVARGERGSVSISHSYAVKEANKLVTRVRKLLGYAVPGGNSFNF